VELAAMAISLGSKKNGCVYPELLQLGGQIWPREIMDF
jgi:hypothetical protein